MANKQLTASVKLNTSQFETKLKRIARSIDAMNNAVRKQHSAYDAVNSALNKNVSATDKLKRSTDDVAKSANKVHNNFKKSKSVIGALGSKLKKLAATYLGVMGAKAVIGASDTITRAQNQLNGVNGGNQKQTAETMDKIYGAAQRSRGNYGGMMTNVSKSMMLAGDSFDGNVDNAIRFQEIMSKAYTIGGATAAEQHSSMYQMIQALGSGTLAGDELRSVREGAPLAYKAIEEFAQKTLQSTESLKDLASQGKITSDMVVAAIMDAGDTIDNQFKDTKITFEQTWDSIKNMGLRAFQPVLIELNEMLNNPAVQQGISMLGNVFLVLGTIISWTFTLVSKMFGLFGTFFNWCAENWSWLSKVILTILTIVGVAMAVILFPKFIAWIQFIIWAIGHYIVLGAQALAAGIKAMIGWMMANWAMLLIILVIVAVIAAVIWLSDSFADAIGMIVGGIMAAVAFVWNLFLSLVDLVLMIVNVLCNRFAAFANFFANVFNDPIGSIIHLFGDLADNVLGILESIASAIDKVFGSNLAGAVSGWRGSLEAKVTGWAEKYGNGKYEKKVSEANLTAESLGLKRWAYGDAYNFGYKWGSDKANALGNMVSGFGDMLKGDGLPNPNAPEYQLDTSNFDDKLGNIADDTSDIKDSLEIDEDDLDFLRKLAEMEWRNEFTTAEIKVEMNNNNTINGDRDLDGIVSYLSDTLRDEMAAVAYGVHY